MCNVGVSLYKDILFWCLHISELGVSDLMLLLPLIRLLGKQTGMTSDSPYLDPCLPVDAQDEIHQNGQIMYLRGTGDFNLCRELIQPFMNKTNETQTSLNGVYQPAVHFQNSEFYGFSEFYYSTEDVLRMGGDYNAAKFIKAAKVRHSPGETLFLVWNSCSTKALYAENLAAKLFL